MSFMERYPLLYAIRETSTSDVTSVIYGGADVNMSDSQGRTALMFGVIYNRERIVSLLIDEGADVNTSDSEGITALMLSVLNNRASMIALLIARGADVNITDNEGKTALMYLRVNFFTHARSLISMLMEAGADINSTDNHGKTALMYAVQNNQASVVENLINVGADVNIADDQGKTALMYLSCDNKSLTSSLMKAGADVNTIDNFGKTVLIHAVQKGKLDLIKELINIGADINTTDNQGKTTLMYAVQNNEVEVVVELINLGADVNIANDRGKTALMYAIQKHKVNLVKVLISLGADVNIADDQGKTALMYCAYFNSNIMSNTVLLKAGADINITDNQCKSALAYSLLNNNGNMALTLTEAGSDVNVIGSDGQAKLLCYAASYGNERVIGILINTGTDLNKTDDQGKIALICAVENGRSRAIDQLIEAGADVNITDNGGKTALMYAAEYRRTMLVVKLIEAGADVNLTDNEGKTALFYGVSDENIVRALIEQGNAVIDKRDQYGRSSLFYAFTKYPFTSAHYLIHKESNLQMKDNVNLSILSFYVEHFIDEPRLKDAVLGFNVNGLNVFQEYGEKRKTIFEVLINLMLCKNLVFTLELKSGYHAWNINKFALHLAKKYVRITDFRKKMIIQKIWKIMNKIQRLTHLEISKLLELLCELGAKPSYADLDGNTALHYATCLPLVGVSQDIVMDILHQLEGLRVSFNAKNHHNETPLLYCLSNKKWITSIQNSHKIKILVDVCKFLLEHGSSVQDATRSGKSVFHLVLELFLQELRLNTTVTRKDVLLGLLELLQLFSSSKVDMGVTVNKRDIHLNSPIHLWVSLAFDLTIDNGISGTDDQYGFEKDLFKKVLRHLIACGTQLDDKNKNGETPLHLCRTWTAVKLLIEAGAQPNVVDAVGRTPLLVASKSIESKQVERFYPDVLQDPKSFWKSAIENRLDPWAVDKNGESVLSVLIKSEAFILTKALVELACEENYIQSDTIAVLLLSAICKDTSTRTQWKSILVEKILKSRKVPLRHKNNDDTPLHFCCRNIANPTEELSFEEGIFPSTSEGTFVNRTKTSVHWTIAKHLLAYGADCNVYNASGKSCLDIAQACPALKDVLTKPLNLDEVPLVFPWTSISVKYKHILAKVARRQECKEVGSFWFHQNNIEKGSFGFVFVGLNEKDGREVAIKRIEKLRILRPEADKKEITNLTLLADCEQVVRYLSFTEDEDFSYIILELMEGNLDDYLSGAFDVNRSITLCCDVVKGLKYLHEQNILHRDLKPTNILFKTYPKLCLKIADFGLSRQIDCTSTTMSGSIAGTRCWIAPEVLKTLSQKHSMASDVFSCGLVLHYVLSVQRHPFFPVDYAKKSELQISNETEANVMTDNLAGWDNSLCPEATDLVKGMLNSDDSKRPKAAEAIAHPLFWSEKKKMDLLIAVGNQPEIECPRGKRKSPLTGVETDLDYSFRTIVNYATWEDPGYVHMPAIYTEMTQKRKSYDTKSVVELVRFIRNTHAHVSDDKRPGPIRKLVLEDFVFLEYFPKLVMEVFNCVKTHGWDSREEIKYVLD